MWIYLKNNWVLFILKVSGSRGSPCIYAYTHTHTHAHIYMLLVCINHLRTGGPGSSVGIATGYGLDGPGIESWWGGEIFRTCPDRPWDPPSLLYNGYRVFPGGKVRPGRDTDPSPLLVPWSRKSRAIPLLPPMSRTACTEPQCLYNRAYAPAYQTVTHTD